MGIQISGGSGGGSGTVTSGGITDATAVGVDVLTATDAAAARAAIGIVADTDPIPVNEGGTNAITAAAARVSLGLDQQGICVWEPTPTAGDVTLVSYAPFACTIDSLVHKTASGSVPVTIKINGTNVTSLVTLTADSTETTTAATGANAVAIGDTISVTYGAPTAAAGLEMTILITR